MNPNEKELQTRVEAGERSADMDVNERAYQIVFNALQKEPDFTLPANFSERLVARIKKEQETKESSKDWILLAIGIVSLSAALIIAIAFTGFKVSLGFLSTMADYAGLFICGVILLAFYNWIDKKVILPKLNNKQPNL
ncbi:hypothetical protein [Chryseosolibacter indicus]|uniref:Uncharacterized protein n=1 Tax=Chryseosolibacter indicus TaxID=2782351 RepID=A0ABS5VXJ1_9BACT|nr:hypothetical protein [Chryseosolibacter indicus]MBT1705469.1 hypothetical protein [Chryseosolibacter indicus]